jgi:hypothetical protein
MTSTSSFEPSENASPVGVTRSMAESDLTLICATIIINCVGREGVTDTHLAPRNCSACANLLHKDQFYIYISVGLAHIRIMRAATTIYLL